MKSKLCQKLKPASLERTSNVSRSWGPPVAVGKGIDMSTAGK